MREPWVITAVDAAYLQGPIDFHSAKSVDNVRLAWIRAGQGGGPSDRIEGYWPDRWCAPNSATAEAARVLRGLYWVYDERRGVSPQDNTDALMTVGSQVGFGELPWWSDLEVFPFTWAAYRAHLVSAEARTGIRPYIYTGSWAIQRKGDAPDWLKEYKFVLTGYNETGPSLYGPLAEVITLKNVVGWQQTNSWHPGWVGGIDRTFIKLIVVEDVDMGEKVVPAQKLLEFIADNAVEVEQPAPPPEPTPDKLELSWPAEQPAVVTQWYGVNKQYYSQFGLPGHEGLDMRAINGSRIFAAADGEVYRVTPNDGNYGIHVRIKHMIGDQQFNTIYAHLQVANVAVGDRVTRGQVIGLADNTGNSSGAHLHFSLKLDGIGEGINDGSFFPSNIINPVPYFSELFPGNGWQVLVNSNLRPVPTTESTPIRLIASGAVVHALDSVPTDWWKVEHQGVVGWLWNPGYKLGAL